MKKLFMFLGLILIITGCGKFGEKDIVKDLTKKIEKANSYKMSATLDIYRNEDKYTYDVESSYKKGDLFKVDLINKNNNHEQIILKNESGVYVLTPALNKSFKFQSDWPYNNSQIYLLQPVINDLKNDKDTKYKKTDNGYTITSKVNYSTEKDFAKQKIYLDKDSNIIKIEVLDKNNSVKMCLTVIDIDYNPKFDDDYFKESRYQINNKQDDKDTNTDKKEEGKEENNQKEEQTSKIEDIVYPMYVPVDTKLSGQDVVETSTGERVILTFTGETPFTVVQETLKDVESTNYIYGDPYLIMDTVGSVTDYSVSWISNGIEYSVMSEDMDVDELLTVAQSISVKAVGK